MDAIPLPTVSLTPSPAAHTSTSPTAHAHFAYIHLAYRVSTSPIAHTSPLTARPRDASPSSPSARYGHEPKNDAGGKPRLFTRLKEKMRTRRFVWFAALLR
ncbi:hypothetical protein B0H10DRAFT_2210960 [Mycena sp. CBHHK59/15]|nr:hypothetical protein B0H10DRAFT_2210960 [Mycena sp. CBHHK59/15]